MKFSYNWLQKHFEEKLPEANELAVKVGLHSFELEGVEEVEINGKKEKVNSEQSTGKEAPLGDTLIEWDVLPNRSSDCLCYMGMAKEVGAVLGLQAKAFAQEGLMDTVFDQELKTSDFLSLEVADKNLVKRATKRLAVDVKVGESPQWLKDTLESMGQKSINNVVDITNYVMWATGQPVHAFDYDKFAGEENKKNIKIAFAKNGEKVTDLSGTEHELDDSVLVISDGEKSLDIAGIKGGNNSGVDENTTRLMLSAVNFEYENIRNTSKKLKLATDASKRFENEVPLRKTILAMGQMSFLLQELAGAKISDEVLDTNPDYKDERVIKCSISKINKLLGVEISENDYIDILYRLDLRGKKDIIGDDVFEINVPEDRLDLNIWQDIAEEVGRIYGYENIEEKFPNEGFKLPEKNVLKESIRKAGDILVENGFYEIYNRTIVKKGSIKLANSLNANATTLRETLLERVQERAVKNLINDPEPKLFEIGKVFAGVLSAEEAEKRNVVVDEYFLFAGVIGKRKIKEKQKEDLFYRTKGYLEMLFENMNIKNIVWKEATDEAKKKDFVSELWNSEEKIGDVGVNFWEMNIEKLVLNIDKTVSYKKASKYPKMDRDVAFWVDMDFTVEEAKKIISEKLPKEAVSLELFDIFKNNEKGKKSFAFNIVFQSEEKTLEDTFVNGVMNEVYKTLGDKGFEIR